MNVTSQVKFNIINEALRVSSPAQGIIFVQGETLRGPINDPEEIITSPKRFRMLFGDTNTTSLFPMVCMAMLERGTFLRVNRITAGTPVKASATPFASGANPIFQIVARYPGVDYNNISATVMAPSNGDPDSFNLVIKHSVDNLMTEVYENIRITGTPSAMASDYLKRVSKNSSIVDVVYSDLSSLTGPVRPTNAVLQLAGGNDGTTPGLVNYVGDQATGTGFHAFNPYDDSYALTCPVIGEGSMTGISVAGTAYAENRKDLVFYTHLGLDNTTKTALLSEKPAINSMWAMISSGGVYVTHPMTGETVEVPEIGYFLAQMVISHRNFGEWYSFFGPTLGQLQGVLGSVNNFGSAALFADLNELAQRQINMMVTRNGITALADAYTSEVDETPTNHVSIVNLLIYIKKFLKPTLESFLGLPLDIPLISSIFYTVKPAFDDLINRRAIFSYSWEGDQFASSINEFQVNSAEDFGMGKYVVNLRLIPIAPLKEIVVNIILTRAGVDLTINN